MTPPSSSSRSPPASTSHSPTSSRSHSHTPALSRSNSFGSVGDLDGPDLLESAPSGTPLADLLETYVNPRLDWAERKFLQPYVNGVKSKARHGRAGFVKRARNQQEIKALEKELSKLRGKVRMVMGQARHRNYRTD